ncbi:MAG TPA: protein translocase subunit SecD [Acidimicrobiales bacterium]|nr:protein translocase subunit SecD [Acidimicrobiales bacterium]
MTILVIAAVALIAALTSGNSPRLGLDLQGGASVVLTPTGTYSSGAINQAQKIINNRVNGLGVSGATVQRQGNFIVVELPGVKNATAALTVIGETAQLQFRPVELDANGQELIYAGSGPRASATAGGSAPSTSAPSAGPATTAAPGTTTPTTKAAAGGQQRLSTAAAGTASSVPTPTAAGTPTSAGGTPTSAATPTTGAPATAGPTTPTTALSPSDGPPITPDSVLSDPNSVNQTVVLPEYTHNQITGRYVLGPVLRDGDYLFTGQIVSTAQANIDQTGVWTVDVTFTGKGGAAWDKVVGGQYYQKYVAIVLDNRVESAPQINAQQFHGQATISGGGSGGFTHAEASNLALVLRYGALPVKLTQNEVRTVSPSLGKASLHAGLIAGFIGLGLVLLYMIFYYRALGIVVVIGLALSASLLYALYTWLGNSSLHASLSLASVVGIIVSVGVTADSYIVYFERLKDDIRGGRSVRSSVDRSFGRAWRTIWTADLVSIIAAVLLYVLTIGDVRGFAFSLGLATALDLVTAYMFTRPMVYMLGRNRTFTEARWLGVSRGLAATPVGGTA